MIVIPLFTKKKAEELENTIDLVKQELLNFLQSLPAHFFSDPFDVIINCSDSTNDTVIEFMNEEEETKSYILIPDLSGDYAISLVKVVLTDICEEFPQTFQFEYDEVDESYYLTITLHRIKKETSCENVTNIMTNFQAFINEKNEYLKSYEKIIESEILISLRKIPTIHLYHELIVRLDVYDTYTNVSAYNNTKQISTTCSSLSTKDYEMICSILTNWEKSHPNYLKVTEFYTNAIKFSLNIRNCEE